MSSRRRRHVAGAKSLGEREVVGVSPECPPGYRLLQPQVLAVGKHGKRVPYISRNPDTPHIHTKIVDINIDGGR